jgi:hypothetical protein
LLKEIENENRGDPWKHSSIPRESGREKEAVVFGETSHPDPKATFDMDQMRQVCTQLSIMIEGKMQKDL